MVTEVDKKSCVETISLAQDMEKRIALATVRLGEVLIRGVAVWRSPYGRLRVYFPSYRLGAGWDEAIYLPEELRTQVEADVIATYRAAKAEAKEEERQQPATQKKSLQPTRISTQQRNRLLRTL